MRLPTTNIRQRLTEDARQMHERLYEAFTAGQVIEWPVPQDTPPYDELQRVQSNLHKFWAARGFKVRTRLAADRLVIRLWLEVKLARAPRVARGDRVSGVKKVGPIVQLVCVECAAPSERRRTWDTFELGECGKCGGDLKRRVNVQAVRSDAKAKRELQEQGA